MDDLNFTKYYIFEKRFMWKTILIPPLPTLAQNILYYTTFTNFSTKYLVMCKVYTDVGGIK